MIALLLALSAPAVAARHELSFEYAATLHGDEVTGDVGGFWAHDGFGLRGGYAVLRDRQRMGLVITGAWSHASRVRDGELFDPAATTYDGTYLGSLEQRWRFDTFALGAKADLDLGNVFYPYVHVQAALIASGLRLDDDPERPGNPNELAARALAPAGVFTVGFELMLPDRKLGWPVTAAFFFDAGYQVAGPLTYGDFGGKVDLSGAVVRTGVGLRM